MLKVSAALIYVLSIFSYQANTLLPELCQKTPKERHCLIEHIVKDRWPHAVRYVYNWYTRNCFEIRWSAYCHKIPNPVTSNNFPTEMECLNQCSGWA